MYIKGSTFSSVRYNIIYALLLGFSSILEKHNTKVGEPRPMELIKYIQTSYILSCIAFGFWMSLYTLSSELGKSILQKKFYIRFFILYQDFRGMSRWNWFRTVPKEQISQISHSIPPSSTHDFHLPIYTIQEPKI